MSTTDQVNQKFKKRISVVGAGLAGSECALQLAHKGFQVDLYEMRGEVMTAAHKTDQCAEIVCSNSFGSLSPISAPGQLKWEAQQLNSFILKCAFEAQVPAGQALGLDRVVFAKAVTKLIENHPNVQLIRKPITSLEEVPRPCVVATGPLTHEPLSQDLKKHFGNEFLYFFDAIAPIIDADSINTEIAWRADRYDKGTPDYLNCPLDKEQYYQFIEEIKSARKVEAKEFEKEELSKTPYFESCMPIEELVDRGDKTLSFGPMKPKGLKNPRTGREPYAVVQLRQENKEATSYNMVGFQTKMAYGEQVRIFRTIPGLENAEFLKLGSIHRNLFLHSPKLLNKDLSSKHDPLLFFAGQITGVEGYFESTCIGLLVAQFLEQKISDQSFSPPPRASALGSLLEAITSEKEHFQPTNINFGLFPGVPQKLPKDEKKALQIKSAQSAMESWVSR
ncbi:MAG: methylenetetrahydrofolate--tRNA-(uracil(54)-C(5))-methyltransferase (FADH(2)-oxidizing) TrmFO [Bdellovibrionales bacterium]